MSPGGGGGGGGSGPGGSDRVMMISSIDTPSDRNASGVYSSQFGFTFRMSSFLAKSLYMN